MSYGLQIAASGVMTAMYRQDVYANNLANMDTPGFKPELPSSCPRDAVRQEDGLAFMPSNALLERLGAGALLNPNRISFAQGSLKTTHNPLDVAIEGSGFLVVRDQRDGDKDRVRLTRDGRLARDPQGRLVLSTTGQPVLNTNGDAITLNGTGPIKIDGDGTVRQGGVEVGRLQFVDVADPSRLTKYGHSQFVAPADAINSRAPAAGTLRQGAYEDSAADEIAMIMQITSSSRDVDANVSMIQQHDRLMDRAINVLGRVG
jgi:flagellar basal body rod protein FlgG